ncbi:MAG: T7SS effector LXG polymorphic toxin, partial [Psychrobacillus sp.]
MKQIVSWIDQVSDIVALPHLDDSSVQEGVISSKRKRDDTLSQLYEFDATQKTALNTMERDIRTMEIWLSDIEGMFKSGLTDVHFQADNWGALAAKNKLKTELASRTSPIAVLSSIVNRENQLTTMLEAFIAGNGPIRFGYGGLIGIHNPFVGTDMLVLSCLKPELNGTEQEDIDQNIFVKYFHSFKGIAQDFWDGVRIRREKALDSPYDFINYWTFGISDGIVSGSNDRSARMFDSKLDFLNYATFGLSGMVKEAILPDDPLSKEHWQNSFEFVGSIIGLRLAATTSPVKKPGNAAGDSKVLDDGNNINESIRNTDEGTYKVTNNAGQQPSGATSKVIEELKGPVIDGKRVGSGKKIDKVNPVWGRDEKGKPFIEKEFPHVVKEHGFADVVDNYSGFAEEFSLVGGDDIKRDLYQITGSNNGKKGVFDG